MPRPSTVCSFVREAPELSGTLGAGPILPKARRRIRRNDPAGAGAARGPMDLSEDQLIEAVARLLSGSEPGVVVGPGDDAAVVEPGRRAARAHDGPPRRGGALRARRDLGTRPRRQGDHRERLGRRGDGGEPPLRARRARGAERRRRGLGDGAGRRDARCLRGVRARAGRRRHEPGRPRRRLGGRGGRGRTRPRGAALGRSRRRPDRRDRARSARRPAASRSRGRRPAERPRRSRSPGAAP